MLDVLDRARAMVERTPTLRITGRVVQVSGLTVTAEGLRLAVGSLCEKIGRAHV